MAVNAFYLVLAGMNQKIRERSMNQSPVHGAAGWTNAPQPLMVDMYRLPDSSFAKRYSKHVVRFPFMMAELYSDVKTASKKSASVAQAC